MTLKNEKIIFIGNQDNIGFLFCKEAAKRGYRCILSMRARMINRSDPDMLCSGEYERHKSWITTDYAAILRLASHYNRVTLISSGIEIKDMLSVNNTRAIKMIIPTGSDLGMWPFVDQKTALVQNYLRYREIFYAKRFEIDKIYAAQMDNVNAARVLGISDKLDSSYIYSIPCEYMRSIPPRRLSCPPDVKRIFFIPGRKNGDPKFTHYKGAEKLPLAFEYAFHRLTDSEKKSIHIAATLQGNTGISYGINEFKRDCEKVFIKNNVTFTWLPNLDAKDLWSIYQDPRLICIDQFGHFHGILGGCAREAAYYGVPIITGSLGPKDYQTIKLYGSSPYVYEAHESDEIANGITHYTKLQTNRFMQAKNQTKAWASILGDSANYDPIFRDIEAIRKKKSVDFA